MRYGPGQPIALVLSAVHRRGKGHSCRSVSVLCSRNVNSNAESGRHLPKSNANQTRSTAPPQAATCPQQLRATDCSDLFG
eukprot:2815740-Rhodomonas_salina.1